jgi:hypothetical protein
VSDFFFNNGPRKIVIEYIAVLGRSRTLKVLIFKLKIVQVTRFENIPTVLNLKFCLIFSYILR